MNNYNHRVRTITPYLGPGFDRLVMDNGLERAEAFTEDYLRSERMYTDQEINLAIRELGRYHTQGEYLNVRLRDDVQ